MVGAIKRPVHEKDVAIVVNEILKQGRYHKILICTPASKDHKKEFLPSTMLLVKAWFCKERSTLPKRVRIANSR